MTARPPSYTDRVRHPDGALKPPQEKRGGVNLWWWIAAGIGAFVLIAIFRPQWLAKIGVHLSGASKAVGTVSNPMGWV